MRTPQLHWRLGRAISGTVFSFVVVVAGMGASELDELAEEGVEDELEQGVSSVSGPLGIGGCPLTDGTFDICFPNPLFPAPNVDCDQDEAAQVEGSVLDCLESVCSGVSNEPEPQFFSRCCFQGGAFQYEQGCVETVKEHCPGVAEFCADRCPSLDVLISGVTLPALRQTCLAEYPDTVADTCALDPFCCNSQWDELCANQLFAARFGL